MCGITGIYAFNEMGRFFMINMARANNALSHRGPDTGRLYNDLFVGLGHRRLSIIDLSTQAVQPMSDPTGRYVLVYNGEVYNFSSLREGLIAKGVEFKSTSDTEVLLQMLIHEGLDCLEKLNGFFAFTFYDKQEQTLWLARDRFGIKPLFYYHDNDKFIFSSEMKGLLEFRIPTELDYTSLYQYFQFNYIPAPATIFENTYKLLPGHILEVKKGEVNEKSFYQLPEAGVKNGIPSYEAACKKLTTLFENAVKDRLVSDVSLGAFLSGGIDSSSVVAMAARHTPQLNTFSVAFPEEPLFDESRYARLVAKKFETNHTEFALRTDDFFGHIFKLLDFYGEPFADASAIPFYILSQETRQKVTVALSGDGADELFAGYHKYMGEWKARENGLAAQILQKALPMLEHLPRNRNSAWGNRFRQWHRFAEGAKLDPAERYWRWCSWQDPATLPSMFLPKIQEKMDNPLYQQRKTTFLEEIEGNDFNEVLRADFRLLLPNDMLHKVDSMSMANSLEVRVPFLDHRLVEFAFHLPASYKINGKMKKRILQDAMRTELPSELYNRSKHGFDVPLMRGYQRELRSWIEKELLDDTFIAEQQLFEPTYIQKLKNQIFNSRQYDQNQVWAILAFQHWWKKFYAPLAMDNQ